MGKSPENAARRKSAQGAELVPVPGQDLTRHAQETPWPLERDLTVPEYRWCVPFLATLAAKGTVTAAADAAQISRTRAYELRNELPEFAALWDEALERAADLLEGEAFRRAYAGVQRGVYYQGERVDTVTEYSDRLMEFLLKGWRPAKFKERIMSPSHISVVINVDGNGLRDATPAIDMEPGERSTGALTT